MIRIRCIYDTDGDGDCDRCWYRGGCEAYRLAINPGLSHGHDYAEFVNLVVRMVAASLNIPPSVVAPIPEQKLITYQPRPVTD